MRKLILTLLILACTAVTGCRLWENVGRGVGSSIGRGLGSLSGSG